MERSAIIRACAILTALIPGFFIVWSHTNRWPEKFAQYTDTFYPNGPTITFNDFTPGSRTGIISEFQGVRVRPITASPVYLLFQPRRHSRVIRVVVRAAPSTEAATTTIGIGFRNGDGVEGNRVVFVAPDEKRDGWFTWSHDINFSDMTVERIDARRIVFDFGSEKNSIWNVRDVRLLYVD